MLGAVGPNRLLQEAQGTFANLKHGRNAAQEGEHILVTQQGGVPANWTSAPRHGPRRVEAALQREAMTRAKAANAKTSPIAM